MSQTTLLKRHEMMERAPLPECHGGNGALDWTNVLSDGDQAGRHVRFLHDNFLAPGVSIGVHRHTDDEEYYYILSGEGIMTLDGVRYAVQSGDITAVFPGGEHGLENTGSEDMHILVISAA